MFRRAKSFLRVSIVCFVALSRVTAQTDDRAEVRRYKLFDVGTLGGPYSGFYNFDYTGTDFSPFGQVFTPSALNRRGQLAGISLYPSNNAGSLLWSGGKVTVLPTLPNGNQMGGGSNALGVNDAGLVIGLSNDGVANPSNNILYNYAVEWINGRIYRLPDLGGHDSGANFVNERGLIVGYAHNTVPDAYSIYGTQVHAATWLNGEIKDLGTLGGPDSEAWTANNHGQVIGISLLNTPPLPPYNQPQTNAFLWSDGVMKDLGNLGGVFSTPTAINNRGQVSVVSLDSTNRFVRSFLWDHGKRTSLNLLGGLFSQAVTLNDEGLMAGSASDPKGIEALAAIWKSSGEGLILGTIGSDPGSIALGINNRDVVVGGSGAINYIALPSYAHAFVWTRDGGLRDLNSLIPAGAGLTLNVAYAINDTGMIAGLGTTAGGDTHAFVLIPDHDHDDEAFESAASAPASPGSSVSMASPAHRMIRPHF